MSERPQSLTPYRGPLVPRPDPRLKSRVHWVWGIFLVLLGAAIVAGAAYLIVRSRSAAVATSATSQMEFGIYPGGPVGTVGTTNLTNSAVAENSAKRLAGLEALRAANSQGADRPFVVRLYDSFTGLPAVDAWTGSTANATTDSEITTFTRHGFDIDLVLRYEPVTSLGAQAVNDYLQYVRALVVHYGPNRHVKYLEITNEANVTNSSQSSDGAYPGSVEALVWGVEAAAQRVAKDKYNTEIGFNWAYDGTADTDQPLWTFIRQQGLAFRKSLSWVGLDDYPGTFTDTTTPPKGTGAALVAGVAQLRGFIHNSGLAGTVPIHITETGYPTGPRRSEASQVTALASLVKSVNAVRLQYHVSDFEWFDLRDSNSSIANVQEQYGLMKDTYKPKSAFGEYESLVSSLGQ